MRLFEAAGAYKQQIDSIEAALLLKKCSDALIFKNSPITRGMSGEADFYILQGDAGSRKSVNTNNIYTLILSEVLGKLGYPKRSASIICGNFANRDYAASYGNPYVILPFNNVPIGVCPDYDMFETEIRLDKKSGSRSIEKLNVEFMQLFNYFNLDLPSNATYQQFIDLLKTVLSDKNFKEFCEQYGSSTFDNLTADTIEATIAQAYSSAGFKLATTKTPTRFNDGFEHEVWIGGPCLAICAHIYKQWINNVNI